MKKGLFSLLVTLCGALCNVQAQNIPIRFNDEWLTLDYDLQPSRCVNIGDTIEVSIDGTWQADNDVTYQSWVLRGDLEFAEGYGASSFPVTRIVSPENGLGKGRISYKYRTTGCSSAVSIDVFKEFELPDSVQIEGPECIIQGQTVVYSIAPLLTKNLGDQIGMDSYSWNVLSANPPSFVDEVLYVSGDSSSVTFLVGQVTDTPIITVSVGRCNSQLRTMSIGNSTPKPELPDTMLVPVGVDSFLVGLHNPNPDVEYTWESNMSAFTVYPYANGDSAVIKIDENARQAGCEIYVTGVYKIITCNTSADTLYVERSWGSNVSIKDNNNINDSCYTIGRNYSFSAIGDIPIDSKYSWTLPAGWEYQNPKDSLKRTIVIRPTSSALLADTLRVRPQNCKDTAHTRVYAVHVKPITIPQAKVVTPPCLDTTITNFIYADTLGMNLPDGIEFQWNISNATIVGGQGTDTIWFTPTTSTNSVQLTLNGENGCDGETTTVSLPIPPTAPTQVLSDNTCLFSTEPLEVTLSVQNPKEGHMYHWTQLPNWTITTPTNVTDSSEVIYSTAGCYQGNYPISVWATTGDGCSSSVAATYTLNVDTIEWEIAYQYSPWSRNYMFILIYQGEAPEELTTANWYVDGSSNYTTTTVYNSTTLPQTLRAEFTIEGCNYDITWFNERSISPRREKNNITELPNLSVYPSPAHDVVEAHWSIEGNFICTIIDATGKIVYENKNFKKDAFVDVRDLQEGWYSFVLRGGKYFSARNFFVKH